MRPTIQPYQYMALRQTVEELINVYQSVNDRHTIQTVQALAIEKMREAVPEDYPEITDLITLALDTRLTKARAARYFDEFKDFVIPFAAPSAKQVEKAFRKVKKLKVPDFNQLDLREHTYIGWNDPGSQKKFLLLYSDDRLQGIAGSLPASVKKNICAICHKESNVALFMATTKTGAEGTYTKKGNYICIDSDQCNRQLTDRENLEHFIEQVKEVK